ncbi:MAG: carboxypeptidase-like regulatory domain-containing protein [Acidobacteriota bacterium]
MRTFGLILLFTPLFTPPVAFAQPPAATAQQSTAQHSTAQHSTAQQSEVKPARIEGRVLVKGTTTPVARAEVKFPGKVTTSADDGSFVLEGIAPGATLGALSATKIGFLDGGASPQATAILLAPGATLKDANVYLLPQAVIGGRIADSNRDPVPGVQALLLRRDFLQGWPQRRWSVNGSVRADDTGAFRIANLKPGHYGLLAFRRQPREFPAGTAPEMEDVATFYPNSPSLSAAVAIDLTAGQEVQGIQIQMRRERVYSLGGKLTTQTISPRALVNVVPEDTELPMGFFAQPMPIRPDGAFEIRGLLPGRYTVITTDSMRGQPAVTGLASITIGDRSITDYAMPNNGGVTLRGSIELEGGDLQKLLPPYDAAAKPSLTIPEATLARWTVLFEQDDKLLPYFDAYVQQDGTFSFENALPFPARLGVTPPKGLYVKSATMGGQDLFRNGLNPALGGDIRVTLAKGAGSATIQVPLPCMVVLWSEEPMLGLSGQGMRAGNATAGTSTSFADLRPGKYYVAAFRDIDMGLAQNRTFLDLIAPDAVKIEIAANGQASAAAPLISEEKMEAAERKVP